MGLPVHQSACTIGLYKRGTAVPQCPICKSEAALLDKISDAIGYDCGEHGRFRVAGSVFATAHLVEATREQWEAALKRAQDRQPNEWAPLIKTTDF
jgi:hypothetical protein